MQPFANVLQNRSSDKFHDIHKKISLFEPLFNEVTHLMACKLFKNRPRHRCFPVDMTKYLRMAFFMEQLHKGERFVKMLFSK